ncbi:hypothetical protein PG984_014223 [Apiospora sp. TS-2023a]
MKSQPLRAEYWAMFAAGTTLDDGFGNCYPWPEYSFRWNGLCSHNALLEVTPIDGQEFSREELEEMDSTRQIRKKEYRKQYWENMDEAQRGERGSRTRPTGCGMGHTPWWMNKKKLEVYAPYPV